MTVGELLSLFPADSTIQINIKTSPNSVVFIPDPGSYQANPKSVASVDKLPVTSINIEIEDMQEFSFSLSANDAINIRGYMLEAYTQQLYQRGLEVSTRNKYIMELKEFFTYLYQSQKVVMKPFEVQHTAEGFTTLIEKLNALDGESRIVMEHTYRYYESFAMSMHRAGFFVSTVNPLVIKEFRGGISVRKVKTDSADAMKIAQFALDKWNILPQYTPSGSNKTAG